MYNFLFCFNVIWQLNNDFFCQKAGSLEDYSRFPNFLFLVIINIEETFSWWLVVSLSSYHQMPYIEETFSCLSNKHSKNGLKKKKMLVSQSCMCGEKCFVFLLVIVGFRKCHHKRKSGTSFMQVGDDKCFIYSFH